MRSVLFQLFCFNQTFVELVHGLANPVMKNTKPCNETKSTTVEDRGKHVYPMTTHIHGGYHQHLQVCLFLTPFMGFIGLDICRNLTMVRETRAHPGCSAQGGYRARKQTGRRFFAATRHHEVEEVIRWMQSNPRSLPHTRNSTGSWETSNPSACQSHRTVHRLKGRRFCSQSYPYD